MAVPIWRDKFCDLGSVASQYFRIRVNSTTIYQGRAFRAASSGKLYIRINDICADWLSQSPAPIPMLSGSTLVFPVTFTIQKSSNGSSWTTVETVAFNDDWSYDRSFDPSTMGMAFPITRRVSINQTIYQTRYASGSVTAVAKYGNITRNITLSLNTTALADAFHLSLVHAGAGYVSFNCATYATYSGKTLTEVTIGLVTYKVAQSCPKYCLYYKNPYGGYDSLLVEGAAVRSHAVERETYNADYDNMVGGREEWNYMNEVTESINVNTGYLTEEESERMPYLLDSTDVFLADLESGGDFVPAVISTDSYSFQSVNRFGAKMKNHIFDVKVAQNTYRR